jgi:AcrR family transcriptional regulator
MGLVPLWCEVVQSFSPPQNFYTNRPDRSEEILLAANELFLSQGYDATSIEDIRKACGFRSKASIYSYFKSKEDVAEAMVQKTAHELKDFIYGEIQLLKTDDLLEQFQIVGNAYIGWALRHPQQYCFRFLRSQQKRLLTGGYDCKEDVLAPLYSQIVALIGGLRANYPVRNLPNEALFTIMLGVVGRAVIDRDEFGDIEIPEKINHILSMSISVLMESPAVFGK